MYKNMSVNSTFFLIIVYMPQIDIVSIYQKSTLNVLWFLNNKIGVFQVRCTHLFLYFYLLIYTGGSVKLWNLRVDVTLLSFVIIMLITVILYFIQIEMDFGYYFIELTVFVYLIPKVVFYWITTGICVEGLSLFWLIPFSMDQRFEQSKIIWECFMLILIFYIGCIPRFLSLKYVTVTAWIQTTTACSNCKSVIK